MRYPTAFESFVPVPSGQITAITRSGEVVQYSVPTVFDLAADPIARDILRHLALQPWQQAHWDALRDRAEELGAEAATKWLDRERVLFHRRPGQEPPRRQRQRLIKRYAAMFANWFGDFSELPF